MKKMTLLAFMVAVIAAFSACDTLKNLPTNTSGGIFSLNGSWKLASSSDNNAQVGTVVTVTPAVSGGFVKTLSNNTYCYRMNDQAWMSISSMSGGGFSGSFLTNACNGSTTYKEGQITVITNSQIRINTQTMGNLSLVQEWNRVTNN